LLPISLTGSFPFLYLLYPFVIISSSFSSSLSVLLESTGWIYFLRHFPWLAGSLGCCFFDCIMIGQVYYYARKNSAPMGPDEREGLLMEENPELED
jgi:hypothetical protein